MDLIKVEKISYIGKITLNSPETLNIIEKETFQEISKVLDEFENSDVKIVLINAICGISKKGKKVFSAGVNLKKYNEEKINLAKTEPKRFREELKASRALITKIETYSKPVVIAIDGFVTGGFFELALGCDVILTSNSAAFSLNEVNIGIIPGYGGIHRLLRIVGKNRAFEIISTARVLKAQDVYNLGIATQILEDEDFEQQALNYCNKLAEQPASSLRLTKNTIQRIFSGEDIDGVELDNFIKAVASDDAASRISSFLNR